ncbi:hypothetical protein DENSPDRAFT_499378 [Dentipellis sp. KUC8613]|nr:hypothetical protein DENSPDRAFT_499378 [Dentipellis sp. KUC8613]
MLLRCHRAVHHPVFVDRPRRFSRRDTTTAAVLFTRPISPRPPDHHPARRSPGPRPRYIGSGTRTATIDAAPDRPRVSHHPPSPDARPALQGGPPQRPALSPIHTRLCMAGCRDSAHHPRLTIGAHSTNRTMHGVCIRSRARDRTVGHKPSRARSHRALVSRLPDLTHLPLRSIGTLHTPPCISRGSRACGDT